MAVKIPSSLEKDIELLRRPEGYLAAGYPRFMGLFGRDSLISSWQLLDYDPSIARGTLLMLSNMQGRKFDSATAEEPGKILHEYNDPRYITDEWFWIYRHYRSWLRLGVPVYFSVDSTPLFIIAAHRYYRATNDSEFIETIWNSLNRAAAWIENYGLKDGLLSYKRVSPDLGLASQSWKDGPNNSFENLTGRIAVVEAQGYAYSAAKAIFELADSIGTEVGGLSDRTADAILERFNEAFWDRAAERAVAVCGVNVISLHTSNSGHLLFSGILDNEQERLVTKSILDRSILSKYGIRTQSSKTKGFDPYSYQCGAVWAHDNWIVAEGLRERGMSSSYRKIRDSVLRAYREKGSMPEFFGVDTDNSLIPDHMMRVPPCSPQAWSSGAVINFLKSK